MQSETEPSAADRAYAAVRSAILNGELSPGSMISEASIARAQSMSRTPVRAALIRLQNEGWVTIYPKRGALVRELSIAAVRESAETRRALESAGVELGTQQSRQEIAARLAENLVRQEEMLTASDYEGFDELTTSFHRGFVEMAENEMMLTVYDRIRDHLTMSMARIVPRIAEDPARVIEEHRLLLDQAANGNWVNFYNHLREHQRRLHGFY